MARMMRKCVACEKTDTAPKHVVVIVTESGDTNVVWHMDCHADATGCEPCTATVEAAEGKKDDELVEHITGEKVDAS